MADVDRILIQPSDEELEQVLGEVVAEVNDKGRKRRLSWPLPEFDDFTGELAKSPEGWWQWNGSGKSGEVRSVLGVAWWTDHIGRRHLRLVGRRDAFRRDRLVHLLCPNVGARPGLCLVYPEAAFLLHRGGRREVAVLCRCGAAGSPQELGWMGPCCGACHDRREAGVPVPRLWTRASFSLPACGRDPALVMALSPDGRTLALGGGRETLSLWEIETGRSLYTIERATRFTCAAFSPDGELATGNTLGDRKQWEVETGKEKALYQAHPMNRNIRRLTYSPDGKLIARGGERGCLLLEANTGQVRHDFRDSLNDVTCQAFSSDGELFAAGTLSGALKVWDTRTAEEIVSQVDFHAALTDLAFAPDLSEDGRVVLAVVTESSDWNAGVSPEEWGRSFLLFLPAHLRGPGAHRFAGHPHGTLAVAFSPDGQTLVTGGRDRLVRLWSLPAVKEMAALEWHLDAVCQVAFSAEGRWLVTGSVDGVARLWPWDGLRSLTS
jgi:hypothetical protein